MVVINFTNCAKEFSNFLQIKILKMSRNKIIWLDPTRHGDFGYAQAFPLRTWSLPSRRLHCVIIYLTTFTFFKNHFHFCQWKQNENDIAWFISFSESFEMFASFIIFIFPLLHLLTTMQQVRILFNLFFRFGAVVTSDRDFWISNKFVSGVFWCRIFFMF